MDNGELFISEDVLEEASAAKYQMLPEKSKLRYQEKLEKFTQWQTEKGIKGIDKNVMMAYFKNMGPTSAWSRYSMLKSTLFVYKNVDISSNMLLSRGLPVLRAINSMKTRSPQALQSLRNSHDWNYRAPGPPASKNIMYMAEGVAGFAWWWVLWHLWTEPGHVFGEFEYPTPSEWTDEELGIPPIE